MAKHHTKHRAAGWVCLGLAAGLLCAFAPACAGKGKGSRSPEQCMTRCEQDKCGYDPNEQGNDEYLECLDACEDECG